MNDTSDPQYKLVTFSNFKLDINLPDSCCKLKCNTVIEISNFAHCRTLNQVVIIGLKYNSMTDLYTKRCLSSIIVIYTVDDLSENYSYWPISEVYQKLLRVRFGTGFVVMPLLHTNE